LFVTVSHDTYVTVVTVIVARRLGSRPHFSFFRWKQEENEWIDIPFLPAPGLRSQYRYFGGVGDQRMERSFLLLIPIIILKKSNAITFCNQALRKDKIPHRSFEFE
jgi:hypothetical protein